MIEKDEKVEYVNILFGDKEIHTVEKVLGKEVEFWLLSAQDVWSVFEESKAQCNDILYRDAMLKYLILRRSISKIDGKPFGGKSNAELLSCSDEMKQAVYEERGNYLKLEHNRILDVLMMKYNLLQVYYEDLIEKKMQELGEAKVPPFGDAGS